MTRVKRLERLPFNNAFSKKTLDEMIVVCIPSNRGEKVNLYAQYSGVYTERGDFRKDPPRRTYEQGRVQNKCRPRPIFNMPPLPREMRPYILHTDIYTIILIYINA